MSKFKCQRCPLRCGYGEPTALIQELTDAPKNMQELMPGYERETPDGYKDDFKEFCSENYKDPAG